MSRPSLSSAEAAVAQRNSAAGVGQSDPNNFWYEPGETIGHTANGLTFLNGNTDSYINASNTQAEWNREDLLRQEAYKRDDFALDRLVEAAKRNGINPIFLLDAFNQQNSASYTTSAAKANSYDTNAKTEAANSAKIVGALLAALAMIAAAAL